VSYKVPEGTVVAEGGATWQLKVELHGCGIHGSPFAVKVSNGVRLCFESAFDTNGVLYYLGTNGGTGEWRNPHEGGRVVANMSTCVSGTAKSLVERDCRKNTHTDNSVGQWVSVDLGEGCTLVPDYYCLRHGYQNTHNQLRSWQLQGSPDGSNWTVLREHSNDSWVQAGFSTGAWPLPAEAVQGRSFRHFRILQTGQNSSNHQHLMCSGIEMYGLFDGPVGAPTAP